MTVPSLVLVAMLIGPPTTTLEAAGPNDVIAKAQSLLDQQRPEDAVDALASLLSQRKPPAPALLLHSTALFMLGEAERGERQLERALKRDPNLRQGWLNRGAIELSRENYEAAYHSFTRAKELDATDPANELNLGVAKLLGGSLDLAEKHFSSYLENTTEPATAHYLVATNYSLAGDLSRTLDHLAQAIDLDERQRLIAKTDSRFHRFKSRPEIRKLFGADSYRLTGNHFVARKNFETPYEIVDRELLSAVVDSLDRLGESYDRHIEVTGSWALIWGDQRIKITNSEHGAGLVEVSALRSDTSVEAFRRDCQRLFDQVLWQLSPKLPTRTSPPGGHE